jgi:uncharacterized RDD family membrane protein YckC
MRSLNLLMQACTPAHGTQPVPYARFWPRFIALFIDWTICVVIPILVAIFAVSATRSDRSALSILDWLWAFLVVFLMLGYFTYFWARGQSLGMKAVGIRMISPRTERPPGVARAAVRAFLFLILLACAFILLSVGFSDPPAGGFSATNLAVIYFLLFLFLSSIVGYFWMIWDPKKQTLQDKLSGVVVVKKIGPAGEDN